LRAFALDRAETYQRAKAAIDEAIERFRAENAAWRSRLVCHSCTPNRLESTDSSSSAFAGWILSNGARSDAIAALGTGLLYGAGLLPLAVPFYLTELGRRYVRAVHGGYQSVTPFVPMYSAANFVLWLCGELGALSTIGYR
jgi:hypothetical protein